MALLLDAGALVAVERGDRAVLGLLLEAQRAGAPVRTSSAVVAQTWRDGRRQARLVRVLAGVEEVPLGPERSRRVGELLAAARTTDVVDAALVELARDGDEVATGDVDDLRHLARAAGRDLLFLRV